MTGKNDFKNVDTFIKLSYVHLFLLNEDALLGNIGAGQGKI